MTQRITPNLWFNGVAEEAVNFYRQAFGDVEITQTTTYPTEGLLDFQEPLAGKILTISFRIADIEFLAINADATFKPNQSMSFVVNFDADVDDNAREHLDSVWQHLEQDGNVLMALQEYPFSKRYGWLEDKYGYSWQFNLGIAAETQHQFIHPGLTFGGDMQHFARPAMTYYSSVFPDSMSHIRYEYGEMQEAPARPKDIGYAQLRLLGLWFSVNDAVVESFPVFNESVSFMVQCNDQSEIDYYWAALSHVPESEQCGWCKDRFGVSWQIVPSNMDELMAKPNAFAALMKMGKIEIAGFDE